MSGEDFAIAVGLTGCFLLLAAVVYILGAFLATE